MVQFTAAASYNITYAPYVSDYSRYLPADTPTSKIVFSVFWGVAGSPLWLIPVGAWLASNLGTSNALVGINTAENNVFSGLGGIVVVLSVLALVATMGLNAYSCMLTVVTASTRSARSPPGVRFGLSRSACWLWSGRSSASACSPTRRPR
jgi:purine-cytosine permease-like protein